MTISRRNLGAALIGFLGGVGVSAGAMRRPRPVVPPPQPPGGPEPVPVGVSRDDAAWLKPKSMLRAQRYTPGGPAVDLTYEVGAQEPADDPTRLALPDGRWGRQVFPSGMLNARGFGARGDGEADDTEALQDFLDAVVARGERGLIPAGTYRITASLRIGDPADQADRRGFTIEGAGRTGLGGNRAPGGTLILLDGRSTAVIEWFGTAWRDSRVSGLGLACLIPDAATFGLVIRSSRVSHLAFEHLHVENVTTAFALLTGDGANGEFCGWSNIQTWRVQNFFYSDAGQAYGLRFSNVFCYYRPGGTLFRIEASVLGGGLHLLNFDASPARLDNGASPSERADTTLLALSDKHTAPITVIGGRFEHITTIADIQSNSVDLIVHNQIQFIGCDFTTDLDRAAVAAGKATIRLRDQALADFNFLNCSFATAFPPRDDQVILFAADEGCRGNIRVIQSGHWGYADQPGYRGPGGDRMRVSWADCVINNLHTGPDWAARARGHRLDRSIDAAPAASATGPSAQVRAEPVDCTRVSLTGSRNDHAAGPC